jgi:hypothetical protein
VTHSVELWQVIRRVLPRDRWLPLSELYARIEAEVRLDAEDFEPSSPRNGEPKWRRNVRNVLQRQKGPGLVLWDRRASYRLP